MMTDDVAVRVEGLSKRFCKDLKRTMLYGLFDIGRALAGVGQNVDGLRRHEFWALQDVSFEVRRGECLGIIGPNGAGKSTLFRVMAGIMVPTGGRVEIRGRLSSLIELGAGFHPMLTGRENVYVNGAVLGMSKREIDRKFDEIVDFAGIGDFIDTPVKFYSSGMRVRLGFAVAAHLEPDVLLIDEVLAVGDVPFRAKCREKIRELQQSDTCLLFVSHNMEMVGRITERACYLKGGRVRTLGPTSEAIAQYRQDVAGEREGGEAAPTGRLRYEVVSETLVDGNGREVTEFQTGEPLHARFVLRCNEPVPLGIGNCWFVGSDGRVCLGCRSDVRDLSGVGPGQEISMSLRIPHFWLSPDTYSVGFEILGPGTLQVHARNTPGHNLTVRGVVDSSGAVQLPHEWTFDIGGERRLGGR